MKKIDELTMEELNVLEKLANKCVKEAIVFDEVLLNDTTELIRCSRENLELLLPDIGDLAMPLICAEISAYVLKTNEIITLSKMVDVLARKGLGEQ